MRVKENECKEKKRYSWSASKEKNIDVAWEVTGKLGHDNVHHHTNHNIQSTAQGMVQALHAGEHLCRVMGNDDCSLDWRV